MIVSSLGDTIFVEMGMHVGFELTTKAANDLLEHPLSHAIPLHSSRLETTGVKTMTITLKYKHIADDASLGFYRSGCFPVSWIIWRSKRDGSRPTSSQLHEDPSFRGA